MLKSRPTTRRVEKRLRDAIWKRDGGRCRASGHWLEKVYGDWDHRGEVAHLQSRSAHPELKYDLANCVLLSAHNHWCSDPRNGSTHRLTIAGEDANGPLEFTMSDKEGRLLWTRTSSPPQVVVDGKID